ncbi:hypothetical protein [Arthrobacter sp. SDTb3-6]|uniref:hypothetical protein n=1 Tax=Arthrobacter sp. SDTb3-6 TaxID=2713571 RepID=UPI00159EA574|nr:hypothetical protein [Arthrobacter sp. SDTb3-6]NVM97673.1 hypothetical protein [Arthrobacter sp. SDTb3-6]
MESIVEPRTESGKTELFPGFDLWNEVTHRLVDYHGYDLEAVVRLVNERYEISTLTVRQRPGGDAITGIGLRGIKPAAIVRNTMIANAGLVLWPRFAFGLLTPAEAAAAKAAGPTMESLQAVARIYRSADAVQEPPTKAVQNIFELPARTAGAWIAKAKAEGLIPRESAATDDAHEPSRERAYSGFDDGPALSDPGHDRTGRDDA